MAQGENQNQCELLPFQHCSITVLLCNIEGEAGSQPGPRNLLVPHIVAKTNPDVLLLQEISTKVLLSTKLISKSKIEHMYKRALIIKRRLG